MPRLAAVSEPEFTHNSLGSGRDCQSSKFILKTYALIKNKNTNAILKGDVKADFFDQDGLLISKLTSDSAYIDQNTNNLHAYGNVRVISDDSVKLFSNSILWDNHYKLIISHDSVMFTSSNNDTMYGVGFESDIDLTQWKIKKPHGTKSEIKND